MTKNVKRFFSMLLALSLVFSLVVPAAATETDVHDHAEEAKQEAPIKPINMEAVLENITVNAEDMEFEVSLDNYVLLADPDFEPDESDPVIITLETELKNITVLDEGTGESVALTEDQINTVLYLYTQYMDHWKANADVLGVQTPFFLQYNDNEDALGVLGEMLVLAGVSVDKVRSGEYTFQELQGTVELFLYAHILGVQYYGSAIEAARDEVLGLIEESGAQTEAQKLLVLNDWMAHINTFDMPYIMNTDKDLDGDGKVSEEEKAAKENKDPMVAEDHQPHELQDEIYDYIYANYEQNLKTTFETQIRDGLEANFKINYYTEFVKNVIYQGALAQAREKVAASIRESEEWLAAYEAEEKKVYDEAYAEYQLNNHEHEVTLTFAWEEVFAEDGTTVTAWKCESAEAKCAVEGCTAVLTAEVELKDETTAAKCEEDGKTVYTATATVTTTDATGETTTVGEPAVETKEVVIKALGHDFVEGVCSRCEAVETPAHVHEAVVTIAWAEDNTATASVICGEGCDGVTVEAPVVTSKNTKEATCNAAGETIYTAAVTVKDSNGNAVENVTVNNATKTVVVPATGEHTYEDGKNGKCDVCGTEHTDHVDITGDGVCDTCYADMPVEHEHSYTWVVTTPATCSAEGVESYKCSDGECGHVSETKAIAKLEHEWVGGYNGDDYQTVEPTCTKSGYIAKGCANCGEKTSEYVDELGHNYVDGKCSRCGEADPDACKHEYDMSRTDGTCIKCNAVHQGHVDNPPDGYCDDCYIEMSASNPSAIPEEITFDAVTLAEDGDDTTGDDTTTDPVDPDLDPDADAYAKAAVEAKKEEIEAAADKAVSLDATVEQAVTGGTEDVDTDIEQECWAQAEAYVAQDDVAAALKEDPAAFVDSVEEFKQEAPVSDGKGGYVTNDDGSLVMMPLNEQAHQGWEQFWTGVENGEKVDVPITDAEGNVTGSTKMTMDEIVDAQMNTPMNDLPQKEDGTHMTPNEAIPVFSDQAATQMTPGVINYWEGSQFGALAMGTSVCLGYTKAFTYLVQCMHPEVYLKDGATDIKNADNWKSAQDLYYNENGELDINQNYVVDAVRVTFDAEVTMFGQTEDNFNSDHFWNAVKVDGEWYYADPCYTDVFTEVMMRDRVETDGQMNHLYFLFSHTSCVELYDGNYKEIKTLYADVATNEQYEDSWMSRIKSNAYFDDGYAYYMYDSTDMLTLMEEYENQNTEADIEDPLYKIVRHKLDSSDDGDGDTDYETLVVFNYTADDDSEAVGRVWDPETKAAVDNELLTELWHKHAAYAEIYPSIAINAALYGDKVYFNLANCILSYDIATSEVAVVKEYNTVYGVRDDTMAFGGMAFTTTSSADSADFTVENRPIAGMTIKNDGNMYVSVATNFAFISGKSDRTDPASDGYGYEYEESNYNPDYNSYMDYSEYDDDELESYGYTKEINDNDEFMWTANFVDKQSMSHLSGSHSYESVSIEATCGIDAYTENRCTTCGAIEADSRVYEEGTALEHHYVEFHETFYTKDDGDAWNTGVCYVCTVCGYAVTEPKEPTGQAATDEAMAEYEEALAIYEAAKESAGHTYVATGETWAEDNSTVTFSTLTCSSVCPERKPYLDCLLDDDTITITLENEVVAETVMTTEGVCTEGLTEIYTASGEVEVNGETVAYEFSKEVKLEPTDCKYVDGVCTVCGDCTVKRISGKDRVKTALSVATALKETLGVEKFEAVVLAIGDNGKFADALAGSYLANVKGAPILLYTSSGLSDLNVAFIEENLVENGTIYLLGGSAAIPDAVKDQLSAYGNVVRLSGKSRYETNLAILKEAGYDKADEVLVATGENFADSLSASAVGLPILLVNGKKTELTAEQIEFLEGLKGTRVTIIGGTGAVSAEIETAIENIVGIDVVRISGKTRHNTSVLIAETYLKNPTCALLTYSQNFPDGLAGGPLAYALGAPLLLTNAGNEAIANEYITENEIDSGYILGGTAAVSDETAKKVFALADNAVITKAYYTE